MPTKPAIPAQFTPELMAQFEAFLQMQAQETAPAPTNGKQVAPARPAGTPAPKGPFAGKSLSDMAAAVDADANALPLVKAELEARVARDGKSAKNAAAALKRLAEGGPLVSPKAVGGNGSKTPAELAAEATQKYSEHVLKLGQEQVELANAQALLAANKGTPLEATAQGMVESAQKRVARRNEYIRIQAGHIKTHGGTVPGSAPRKARTRKAAA